MSSDKQASAAGNRRSTFETLESGFDTPRGKLINGFIAVVSYEITGLTTDDEEYDPYPRGIYIHGNEYSNNGSDPQGLALDVAGLFDVVGTTIPDIVYDGLGELGDVVIADGDRICVDEGDEVTMGYVFSASGLAAVGAELFDCAHASLTAVVLDAPEEIVAGEAPPTDEEIAALCDTDGPDANFDAGAVNCLLLSSYRLFLDTTEPVRTPTTGCYTT